LRDCLGIRLSHLLYADKCVYTANPTQSLVTLEALSGVYTLMRTLLDELPEIDLLFRLSNEKDAKHVYRGALADPVTTRRGREIPIQTARCQERQKVRLALPLLPVFPDEP
jgi:hypothetical protein